MLEIWKLKSLTRKRTHIHIINLPPRPQESGGSAFLTNSFHRDNFCEKIKKQMKNDFDFLLLDFSAPLPPPPSPSKKQKAKNKNSKLITRPSLRFMFSLKGV